MSNAINPNKSSFFRDCVRKASNGVSTYYRIEDGNSRASAFNLSPMQVSFKLINEDVKVKEIEEITKVIKGETSYNPYKFFNICLMNATTEDEVLYCCSLMGRRYSLPLEVPSDLGPLYFSAIKKMLWEKI